MIELKFIMPHSELISNTKYATREEAEKAIFEMGFEKSDQKDLYEEPAQYGEKSFILLLEK